MTVQAFLRRLVVVRNDRQTGVRADLLRVGSELDRLGGRIGARPGDDRNAPRRMLDGGFQQEAMLVDIDGRRFAGRADGDDGARAVGDVKVDELAICGEIKRAAGLHRRGDRDQATSQHEKPF